MLVKPRACGGAPRPEGGSGVGAVAANRGGRGDYAERENEQDPHDWILGEIMAKMD